MAINSEQTNSKNAQVRGKHAKHAKYVLSIEFDSPSDSPSGVPSKKSISPDDSFFTKRVCKHAKQPSRAPEPKSSFSASNNVNAKTVVESAPSGVNHNANGETTRIHTASSHIKSSPNNDAEIGSTAEIVRRARHAKHARITTTEKAPAEMGTRTTSASASSVSAFSAHTASMFASNTPAPKHTTQNAPSPRSAPTQLHTPAQFHTPVQLRTQPQFRTQTHSHTPSQFHTSTRVNTPAQVHAHSNTAENKAENKADEQRAKMRETISQISPPTPAKTQKQSGTSKTGKHAQTHAKSSYILDSILSKKDISKIVRTFIIVVCALIALCAALYFALPSASNVSINTAEEITVTYDSRGGSAAHFAGSATDTSKVKCNSTYGSAIFSDNNTHNALPTSEKTGYRFLGWFTQPDGGSQVSANSQVEIASDHTLYAHWAKETLYF